jgi:N-acetylmuramoyl-L-alanine amidase
MGYYWKNMESIPRPPSNQTFHRRSGIPTGRILQTTLSVAIVLATLFTGFPPHLLTGDWRLRLLLTPEAPINLAVPTSDMALHIGIISGHWGNDSGAVCPNGTTEAQVNYNIANLVAQKLSARGYNVDLLQEFDSRLAGYQATVLLSIHNDSCNYINEQATGFKIAASDYSRDSNLSNRLLACLEDRYTKTTGLSFNPGSITADMKDYHAFREISPSTTAAIIETGFLNKDYAILTQRPDVVANGIVDGILCLTQNESVPPTPTPPSP